MQSFALEVDSIQLNKHVAQVYPSHECVVFFDCKKERNINMLFLRTIPLPTIIEGFNSSKRRKKMNRLVIILFDDNIVRDNVNSCIKTFSFFLLQRVLIFQVQLLNLFGRMVAKEIMSSFSSFLDRKEPTMIKYFITFIFWNVAYKLFYKFT